MGLEARVPCPVCRGWIHPVAGRCKHCKTDLAVLREGRPQAQTALPSLGNRTSNDRPVAGPRMPARMGSGRGALPPGGLSTGDQSYLATATFSLGSAVPSNRVLPPRPTGRQQTAAPTAPTWPIIVIALSAIAIILACGALAASPH